MSCGQIIFPMEVAIALLTKGFLEAGGSVPNCWSSPSWAITGEGVAGTEGARTIAVGLNGEASGGASALSPAPPAPAPVLGLRLRLWDTDPGHISTPMFVPTAAMYPDGSPRFPGIGLGETVPSRTGTKLFGFVWLNVLSRLDPGIGGLK